MEPKVNPIRKQGERNIYCPFYNECLDYAVKHFWQSWSCSECPHRSIQSLTQCEYIINDADPYHDSLPGLARGIGKNLFD